MRNLGRNRGLRHVAILLMLGLWATSASPAETPVTATVIVNGGGATSAVTLLKRWFGDFARVDPSAQFNYQAVGSGKGQKLIEDRLIDFGVSDAPMNNEALANAPGKFCRSPS
jgi:phosphate transport system substrate-binding protein